MNAADMKNAGVVAGPNFKMKSFKVVISTSTSNNYSIFTVQYKNLEKTNPTSGRQGGEGIRGRSYCCDFF